MSRNATEGLTRITTTIIAPTPLVAANFVILGQLIIRLGSRFSRMGAKTCEKPSYLVSLVLNAP